MPSMAMTRPMLRQTGALSRTVARRFESSTATKAAETAKESASKATSTAAEYTARAQQGLSRVASSAGPAIANATKGVVNSLNKVGGRTGRFIGFVERQIPHVVYWSKVGAELSKIVFKGQSMSPPPMQTFQNYFQSTWKLVQNPNQLLHTASQTAAKATHESASILQRARNLNRRQLVAGGVIAAECLGFFTVGEMIGRFKIIGYHGEPESAHH